MHLFNLKQLRYSSLFHKYELLSYFYFMKIYLVTLYWVYWKVSLIFEHVPVDYGSFL